ncbi:hypothetical protein [Rhodothermus profundi]|nr:hypothetical protein [Rhodothermus profundi]
MLGTFESASAQGVADPLLHQGLNQTVWPGARVRAMGGVVAGAYQDVTALFADPAALSGLRQPEIRIGGSYGTTSLEQEVRWIPNRIYAELSLVLENDPDKLVITRPFDSIRPPWHYRYSAARPTVIAVGVPFSARGMSWGVGIGLGQLAVLDHYYQNNNALDPNIGQLRPAPIPRVQEGDSLLVDWFQFMRERTGALYGVTPAISVQFGRFAFGLSVTVLTGTSEDWQYRRDRGQFVLRYNNDFSLRPPSQGEEMLAGSSKYRGVRTVLSGRFASDRFALGIVVRPGYTLERRWKTTEGVAREGVDKLQIPLQVTLGLVLYPTNAWRLAVDYDLHQLDKVQYVPSGGASFTPWVGKSTLRLGVEFRVNDWLALRAGYRDEPQGFVPAGAAFVNDPAMASVYTVGSGVHFGRFGFDFSYELFRLRYDDLWLSNVNTNRIVAHTVLLEASYRL